MLLGLYLCPVHELRLILNPCSDAVPIFCIISICCTADTIFVSCFFCAAITVPTNCPLVLLLSYPYDHLLLIRLVLSKKLTYGIIVVILIRHCKLKIYFNIKIFITIIQWTCFVCFAYRTTGTGYGDSVRSSTDTGHAYSVSRIAGTWYGYSAAVQQLHDMAQPVSQQLQGINTFTGGSRLC